MIWGCSGKTVAGTVAKTVAGTVVKTVAGTDIMLLYGLAFAESTNSPPGSGPNPDLPSLLPVEQSEPVPASHKKHKGGSSERDPSPESFHSGDVCVSPALPSPESEGFHHKVDYRKVG